MPKYSLMNNNDANEVVDLSEDNVLEAALEALEMLGYSLTENDDEEAAEAEYLKDCKNGLYADKIDIAN